MRTKMLSTMSSRRFVLLVLLSLVGLITACWKPSIQGVDSSLANKKLPRKVVRKEEVHHQRNKDHKNTPDNLRRRGFFPKESPEKKKNHTTGGPALNDEYIRQIALMVSYQ
jgi:hypothetical protein